MTTMAKVLQGRCAIVTGASQGLGLAIAQAYVAAGASVMICARAQPPLDRAVGLLSKCAGSAQSIVALCADVSKPA
jgi:NAD(P)-dependent dehydrogenase (short-subunit alcohol dehydrogenase family)